MDVAVDWLVISENAIQSLPATCMGDDREARTYYISQVERTDQIRA